MNQMSRQNNNSSHRPTQLGEGYQPLPSFRDGYQPTKQQQGGNGNASNPNRPTPPSGGSGVPKQNN